jgi:hypothetical protein
MPNIEILRRFNESVILEAVQASNKMKAEREARKKAEAVSVESRQKVAV